MRYPLYWDGSHDQEWWHVERGSAASHAWGTVQSNHCLCGAEYAVQGECGAAGGTSVIDAQASQPPGASVYRLHWTWQWGSNGNLQLSDLDELTFQVFFDRQGSGYQAVVNLYSNGGAATDVRIWVAPGAWLTCASLPWPTIPAPGSGDLVHSASLIVDTASGTYREVAIDGYCASEVEAGFPAIGTAGSASPGVLLETVTFETLNTGDTNYIWLGPHCIEALDL
jgi:hypothetical protein